MDSDGDPCDREYQHRRDRYRDRTARYGSECAICWRRARSGTLAVDTHRLFPRRREHVLGARMDWPPEKSEVHPSEYGGFERR
jgi:hypothetical protein